MCDYRNENEVDFSGIGTRIYEWLQNAAFYPRSSFQVKFLEKQKIYILTTVKIICQRRGS
jgi:hypothetical protein